MCTVQLSGCDVISWMYSPTGSFILCPGDISTSTVFSSGCNRFVILPLVQGEKAVVVARLVVGVFTVVDLVVGAVVASVVVGLAVGIDVAVGVDDLGD